MTKQNTTMPFANLDSRSLNALQTVAEKHLTALKRYEKNYEEVVKAISSLIDDSQKQIVCCICGQMVYDLLSCNPDPVSLSGRCCRECDVEIVIPARAKQHHLFLDVFDK